MQSCSPLFATRCDVGQANWILQCRSTRLGWIKQDLQVCHSWSCMRCTICLTSGSSYSKIVAETEPYTGNFNFRTLYYSTFKHLRSTSMNATICIPTAPPRFPRPTSSKASELQSIWVIMRRPHPLRRQVRKNVSRTDLARSRSS